MQVYKERARKKAELNYNRPFELNLNSTWLILVDLDIFVPEEKFVYRQEHKEKKSKKSNLTFTFCFWLHEKASENIMELSINIDNDEQLSKCFHESMNSRVYI